MLDYKTVFIFGNFSYDTAANTSQVSILKSDIERCSLTGGREQKEREVRG